MLLLFIPNASYSSDGSGGMMEAAISVVGAV